MGALDEWRFCPRCGGDLASVEDHLVCPDCGEELWANAIPGVQGILERDGRVLLARRGREPRRDFWDLPGGFLYETEGAEDGLRREFREETGLEIEPVRLLRIDIEPYGGRTVFSVTWLVAARVSRSRPTMSPNCAGSRGTSFPRWRSPARISCWPPGPHVNSSPRPSRA